MYCRGHTGHSKERDFHPICLLIQANAKLQTPTEDIGRREKEMRSPGSSTLGRFAARGGTRFLRCRS